MIGNNKEKNTKNAETNSPTHIYFHTQIQIVNQEVYSVIAKHACVFLFFIPFISVLSLVARFFLPVAGVLPRSMWNSTESVAINSQPVELLRA